MTKKDKQIIVTSIAVSIFMGAVVLAVILVKNRNKLKKRKLQAIVEEDLKYWENINEISLKGAKKLQEWWKMMGFNYSVEQLMTPSFQSQRYWSAIYISSLMKRWGAGNRFEYSPSHSTFIIDGKTSRLKKDNKIFWTYKPAEVKIAIGDIIALPRKSSITFDNLYIGAPTHSDVVFDIKKTSKGYIALLIGGNLSNTVKTTKLLLNKDKKIADTNGILAVLKNQDI